MNKVLTLLDKIDDVKKALDAEAYLSAMAICLTLPDILAQIEYPEIQSVGERYRKWMDEFFVPYEYVPSGSDDEASKQMDKLNEEMDGEFYYQLRNSFLHSGNNDVSKVVKPLDFSLSFDRGSTASVTV